MAAQNLGNHRRLVILYHVVLGGMLFANLVYWIRVARKTHPPEVIFQLIVAVALFLVAWYARQFALTVQDRVIRLELRLRLQALAPELMSRFSQLTPAQFTALRFAGDQELPALVRDVLDGRVVSSADIKQRITDWQPDHLRA